MILPPSGQRVFLFYTCDLLIRPELEEDENKGLVPGSYEAFLAEAAKKEKMIDRREQIIGTRGEPTYYCPIKKATAAARAQLRDP